MAGWICSGARAEMHFLGARFLRNLRLLPMKNFFYALVVCVLWGMWGTGYAQPSTCAEHAVSQARKLLSFHADGDDRIAVDDKVKELPPLRNPADAQQRFQVLEVWGHVYKARYRLRLIYATIGGSCTLMGQEVLEYTKL
jgi:hypothetical protein